jgi:hypothetical protein
MSRILLRLMLVFFLNNKPFKAMKKNLWGTILKIIIAVASAVAGALGYSVMS